MAAGKVGVLSHSRGGPKSKRRRVEGRTQTLGFLRGGGGAAPAAERLVWASAIGDGVRGQGAVQGGVVLRGHWGAAFLSVRGVPRVRGSCVTLRHRPYRVHGTDLCDCPCVHLPGHSASTRLRGLGPVDVPRPLCCHMWATPRSQAPWQEDYLCPPALSQAGSHQL